MLSKIRSAPIEPASRQPPFNTPAASQLARLILLLGALVPLASIALTFRTYMPCPFWDEWAQVNAIANGAGSSSGSWLWSQHNEHRLAITRLLILADLHWFGARNISLFFEMYLAQISACLAICVAIQRFTDFPPFLKATLQGLFGFCLFHFNQAENFTWAFQVSFILPFALGTLSLLAVAFFERFSQPVLVAVFVGLAPFLAALNLSGGLLIGPVALAFAFLRGLPRRYLAIMCALILVGATAYLVGYRVPPSPLPPAAALAHPKALFVYLLTYFGASWTRLLPHKERALCFLSLLAFAALFVRAIRRRASTGPFEWFCIASCLLMLLTAAVTGLGRLQYGVGQAYAGRYQTPAMLYWACLCALLLVAVWRSSPSRFLAVQACVFLLLVASAATLLPLWHVTASHGDSLCRACRLAMQGNHDPQASKLLYGSPRDLAPGVAYLHKRWGR